MARRCDGTVPSRYGSYCRVCLNVRYVRNLGLASPHELFARLDSVANSGTPLANRPLRSAGYPHPKSDRHTQVRYVRDPRKRRFPVRVVAELASIKPQRR